MRLTPTGGLPNGDARGNLRSTRAIESLVTAGVLTETTGKRRSRSFSYTAYLDRLRVGTDLDLAP